MTDGPDRDAVDEMIAWAQGQPRTDDLEPAPDAPGDAADRCPVSAILSGTSLTAGQRLHVKGCPTCQRLAERARGSDPARIGGELRMAISFDDPTAPRSYWSHDDASGTRLDVEVPGQAIRFRLFVPEAEPGDELLVVIEMNGQERVRQEVTVGFTRWAVFDIAEPLGEDAKPTWRIERLPRKTD